MAGFLNETFPFLAIEVDGFAVLRSLLRVVLIVAAGYVIYRLIYAVAEAIVRRTLGRKSFVDQEHLAAADRLVKTFLQVVTVVGTVIVLARVLGVDVSAVLVGPWRGYIFAPLLAFAAHLVIRIGSLFIDQLFDRAEAEGRVANLGRAETMRGLLKSVLRYTVDIAAVLLVLSNLGVNTTGLLASVGIAGLAIGFGAQSLVRDVITGFFILFENQFFVGDYIQAAGVEGVVEEIGLRTTKIRDFGGQVHIVPNGQIDKVTNFSAGPMRVMFDVPIAYDEDVNAAIKVIEDACARFAAGDRRIVDPPVVLGVSAVSDSAVSITVWARTVPMEQWAVGRDLRRAIKVALDEAGIKPPYPRRVWISEQSGHGAGSQDTTGPQQGQIPEV